MNTSNRFSFNLIDEQWVPCIRQGQSSSELLTLRQTLVEAHALKEIYAESPLVTASLYRLCLAVLHCVFGPRDHREWHTLWQQAKRWDEDVLNAYLDKPEVYSRFDLFGVKSAFYQAADKRVKPISIASLIIGVASGNEATLFDHTTEGKGLTLTPAQAARALVTAQAFGLGGLSGVRNVSFVDAAGAQGIVFLVEGENLFETLVLNLVQYPPQDDVLQTDLRRDKPTWQMEDPLTPRTRPFGYLDFLTWPNRRILLLPEQEGESVVVRQMTWAPDLQMSKDVRDPAKHHRKNNDPKSDQPWLPLRFSVSKALWRDSATLFQKEDANSCPPYACRWLSDLAHPRHDYLDSSRKYRLMAFGIAKDRANVFFYRAERLPLPLKLLADETGILVGALSEAVTMAEKTARVLQAAVNQLATSLIRPENRSEAPKATPSTGDKPGKRKGKKSADEEAGGKRDDTRDKLVNSWGAEGRFWGQLEPSFWQFVDVLTQSEDEDARESSRQMWSDTLRGAAWDALALAERYAGNTPRALKAAVMARTRLKMGLGRVLQKAKSTPEEETV